MAIIHIRRIIQGLSIFVYFIVAKKKKLVQTFLFIGPKVYSKYNKMFVTINTRPYWTRYINQLNNISLRRNFFCAVRKTQTM